MRELLVATPLKYSAVSGAHQFLNGVSIRALSSILWETSAVKGFISASLREKLSEARYWLCAADNYEDGSNDAGHELYHKARCAAWAAQIICPSGARHIFLKLQNTDSGYDIIGTECPQEMCRSPLVGRLIKLEDRGVTKDFDAVYAGVMRAFAEKVVRIQNPILLVEQGMQTGNPYLAEMMFVMGLDMLFMAGDIDSFMKRLGGFLGLDSFVFPELSVMGTGIQPSTIVRDVLYEVYGLRNIIAHGQEIPESPYRKPIDLVGVNGERINYVDYARANLLMECALFMVTTTLRRIFTEGLIDEVKAPEKWRHKLMLYEHRYKDANGPDTSKRRGR